MYTCLSQSKYSVYDFWFLPYFLRNPFSQIRLKLVLYCKDIHDVHMDKVDARCFPPPLKMARA